jgi:hypothetical protein
MLTRLKALSLLAPEAVILTPVADSDVLVAHKNGTDTRQGRRAPQITQITHKKGSENHLFLSFSQ